MATVTPTRTAVLVAALIGAVLLVVYSGAAPAHNKAKAQWNPESVNVTIQPGQTRNIPVTLTAGKNLPDAVVRISPELLSYATITPTTIGKTRKGTSIPLTLTLAVPIDALPATTTGTIALQKARQYDEHDDDNGDSDDSDSDRDGNGKAKLIGKPLPVRLDVLWPKETLSSGIIVTYPPALVASVEADTGELSLIPQGQGIEGGGISVSVDANPNQLSMTDYYTGNPGADLGASVGTTSVAGRVGFIFEPRNTMACDVVVIVQNSDGSFINIDDYGCGFQGNGIFDAVVRLIKLPN